MKPFTKHIAGIGRTVALSLFLTSAGFTTVLHHCTMSSDKSECCDTSHSDGHSQCESPMVPSPGQPSVQNGFQCHTTTFAGGLSDIQGLLEKMTKHQTVEQQIIPVAVVGDVSVIIFAPRFHSLTAYEHGVSPPSVEKYVLISSFLI
ncbi:MAG: hypothetical protein ABI623_08015 [bacterium]